jgi:hypothetical protein
MVNAILKMNAKIKAHIEAINQTFINRYTLYNKDNNFGIGDQRHSTSVNSKVTEVLQISSR